MGIKLYLNPIPGGIGAKCPHLGDYKRYQDRLKSKLVYFLKFRKIEINFTTLAKLFTFKNYDNFRKEEKVGLNKFHHTFLRSPIMKIKRII